MHSCASRIARILTLVLIALAAAGTPFRAAAAGTMFEANTQETISLDNAVIDIWPEYDQPGVLVMYNITLSSDVKLPASLTLSIPASAGQPHAVATSDPNGLYNLQYDQAVDGDWIRLSFRTSMPEIRVEYYDSSLIKQENQRSFTFLWPADYPTRNLTVQVQQPVNASAMSFNREVGTGIANEEGLTYYTLLAGAQEAGSEYRLDISYQKADDTLTNPGSFQPAQPLETIDDRTSGRVTLNEILPWTLGVLGVMLIGTGVLWYWRAGREPAPASARPRHGRRGDAVQNSTASGSKSDGIYCHQCGKRAAAGDVFCRTCGTRLRA